MPIDTSMYQNLKLPDFLGSYMQGAEWRQKKDDRLKADQTNQAMKNIYSMRPDGTMAIDEKQLQAFAQVDPQAAYKIRNDLETQRLDQDYKKKQLAVEWAKVNKDKKEGPKLGVGDEKLVVDSANKYSDVASIKDSMDSVLKILNDPTVSDDQKLIAATGSLKLVNSASLNSPDVVGAEESKRVGAFLNPGWGNLMPGQAGPGPLSKPNVAAYTQQLTKMSNSLGTRANQLNERIAKTTGSGLKGATNYSEAPPPPDPDVAAYAKEHGLDVKVAEQIVDMRKKKQQAFQTASRK